MKNSYAFIFIALILACQERQESIQENVKSLTSIEQQTEFLSEIYMEDQKVRRDESAVLITHGHDSPEYDNAWKLINETDSINLLKIAAYLKVHGHPNKEEHGSDATSAPWIVIHHQSENGPRYDFFKDLYKAYLSGDLDGGQFTFYLGRMRSFEFGHRITFDKPFTEEMEIDTLLKALNLDDEAMQVSSIMTK